MTSETSQVWKFLCFAAAKEATLYTITTFFVLQGKDNFR